MLETMLQHLETGYKSNSNPYHNNLHACEVLQTTNYFISQTGLSVHLKYETKYLILSIKRYRGYLYLPGLRNYIFATLFLQNWMSDLEIFTSLIAAIIHDFDHTGTTNNFHVNSGSNLAILYNDRAVLENHHVSAFFRYVKGTVMVI